MTIRLLTENVFQEKKQIPCCNLGELFIVPAFLMGVTVNPWQCGDVNHTKQWTLISPWYSCACIHADLHGLPWPHCVAVHSAFFPSYSHLPKLQKHQNIFLWVMLIEAFCNRSLILVYCSFSLCYPCYFTTE